MSEPQAEISGVVDVSNYLYDFRKRGSAPDGELATALGGTLQPGQVLDGQAGGFEMAVAACEAVELVLQRLLEGRDGLRYFAGVRSVSPCVWANVPFLHHAVRSIAELALHMWCDFPDDPAKPYEMPGFTPAELDVVADLLAAAEVYAGLMAARRRVAKGQLVTVTGIAPFDLDVSDNTGGIADLIELRDQRVMANTNLLAAFSGVLTEEVEPEHDHRIVAAEYVPIEELAPLIFPPDGEIRPVMCGDWFGLGVRIIDPRSFVYRAGSLVYLSERTAHLAALDDDLLKKHGFGAADLETVLECLSGRLTEDGAPPLSMQDHGFAVIDYPSDEALAEAAAQAGNSLGRTLNIDSVRSALVFLDAGVDQTLLSQAPLQRPLRRMGSRLLYDGANVEMSPAALWGADVSEEVSQRLEKGFESLVHDRLSALGTQPWGPGKALKRPDGSLITDADASVQIGDLLVAVDCYAPTWTASLDEGTFNVTRNRADRIIDKLRKWQAQWDEVRSNYSHLLPAGVTEVLSVVVTPGAEWIKSLDVDLWLEPTVPRICTFQELTEHLKNRHA